MNKKIIQIGRASIWERFLLLFLPRIIGIVRYPDGDTVMVVHKETLKRQYVYYSTTVPDDGTLFNKDNRYVANAEVILSKELH